MKIGNITNFTQIKTNSLNNIHTSKENGDNIGKSKDTFIKSDKPNNKLDLYTKKITPNRLSLDKGTASHTTVFVNRQAFDKILNETTYGETKWEEFGVSNNKRWVVVNGQRFEVEQSAEEKARIKNATKTLVDYILESEENIKEKEKYKDNGIGKPKGNIEALEDNQEVMNLLGKIFNSSNTEEILGSLS